MKKTHYNAKNIVRARENRKVRTRTDQEGKLWHLFLKKFEYNFTRQYCVGEYILDFYCPSRNIAIEIDGGGHYEERQMVYDKQRTEFLESQGIIVKRYTNEDIDKNLKAVIDDIRYNLFNIIQ